MNIELKTLADIEKLPVTITYVGAMQKEDWGINGKPQEVDTWNVSFTYPNGFFTVPYYTGTGLRKEVKGPRAFNVKTTKIVGNKWVTAEPVKPKIVDVMYCLLMDASAADDNFHDWCANFGYDDDSIKALNTYKECLEIATKLRKVFTRTQLEKLRELLQDY